MSSENPNTPSSPSLKPLLSVQRFRGAQLACAAAVARVVSFVERFVPLSLWHILFHVALDSHMRHSEQTSPPTARAGRGCQVSFVNFLTPTSFWIVCCDTPNTFAACRRLMPLLTKALAPLPSRVWYVSPEASHGDQADVETKRRLPGAVSVRAAARDQYRALNPVALLAEIRAAQEELGNRIDRRAGDARCQQRAGKGIAPQRVQSSTPDAVAFAKTLGTTIEVRDPRATHRRPKRPYETRSR
jgi:hypothetical protein